MSYHNPLIWKKCVLEVSTNEPRFHLNFKFPKDWGNENKCESFIGSQQSKTEITLKTPRCLFTVEYSGNS